MENKDHIISAFSKVKADINFLNNEILKLKIHIGELKDFIKLQEKSHNSALNQISTLRQINSTDSVTSTQNSTVPLEIEGLKSQNLGISTGNKGASTDRQTDTSTDTSTHLIIENRPKSIESNIKEVSEILNSLDSIKKEIRLKFKHLTNQEMLVFSTIYQLEEQNIEDITYGLLSKNLKLSESSIRDYVQRMILKGIPLKKEKINNKKIALKISPELKRISSLSTIIQLREI